MSYQGTEVNREVDSGRGVPRLPPRASKLNLEMSRHGDTLVSRNWSDRRAKRRTRAQKRDCSRFATSGDRSEIRLGLAVGEHNDKKTHDAPLSLPSPLRPRVFLLLLFFPLAFVYFFLLVISINGRNRTLESLLLVLCFVEIFRESERFRGGSREGVYGEYTSA